MRIKNYYSADQITNGLYTFGKEWQLADETEYIGLYHRYATGEVFTEAKWNKYKSQSLFPYQNDSKPVKTYKQINGSIKTKYKSPNNYFVSVTPADISNRFITRYILNRVNTDKFIEIDKKQYKEYRQQKIDNNIYLLVEIRWYIAGSIETQFQGNNKQPGVIELNQQSIHLAKQQNPNIVKYLTNPLEFYIDTDLVIPPDIN